MASDIDLVYRERVAQMSGSERLARVGSLLSIAAQILAHQVRQSEPNLSEAQVRLRVAQRFYHREQAINVLLSGVVE